MQHLPMRHRVFARRLQSRTIHKVQHHAMWQFLAIQVWRVRHVELAEMVPLRGNFLLNVRGVRDGEDQVASFVDFD